MNCIVLLLANICVLCGLCSLADALATCDAVLSINHGNLAETDFVLLLTCLLVQLTTPKTCLLVQGR